MWKAEEGDLNSPKLQAQRDTLPQLQKDPLQLQLDMDTLVVEVGAQTPLVDVSECCWIGGVCRLPRCLFPCCKTIRLTAPQTQAQSGPRVGGAPGLSMVPSQSRVRAEPRCAFRRQDRIDAFGLAVVLVTFMY